MSYENYRFIRNHSLNGFKLSYRYGYLLEQLPNSLFIINSTANYFSRTSKDLLTITKLKKKRSGNAIVGKK